MHKKCHIKLNRNPFMRVFNLGFYTSYSIIVSRLGILLVQNQVQCLLPCHINGLCDHRTLYKVSITNGWYAHATTMLFETLRKIGSYIYIYNNNNEFVLTWILPRKNTTGCLHLAVSLPDWLESLQNLTMHSYRRRGEDRETVRIIRRKGK